MRRNRRGTNAERYLCAVVGVVVYGAVYCWLASYIPLDNTNIPIEWIPIVVGLMCSFLSVAVCVELLLRRK